MNQARKKHHTRQKQCFIVAATLCCSCGVVLAQPGYTTESGAKPQTGHFGDQGDGTYRNPILAMDYSDPDPVRLADGFYLVSSTFESVPGVRVLHYATLGVLQHDGPRKFVYTENGNAANEPAFQVAANDLWTRSTIALDSVKYYSVSFDRHSFTSVGGHYALLADNYRGDMVGIYTYNPAGVAGSLDVDLLQYANTHL
jgi:hypothetical protein